MARGMQVDNAVRTFTLRMEGDLDPSGFLEGAPGVRMGFEEIRFTPYIKTSSSAADVERFMAFMKARCPVSDNLMNPTEIEAQAPVFE